MALELAQVVTELVEGVVVLRQMKGGQDGLVELLGGCAAQLVAAVEQDLQQADGHEA